jgi:hypothetical protein
MRSDDSPSFVWTFRDIRSLQFEWESCLRFADGCELVQKKMLCLCRLTKSRVGLKCVCVCVCERERQKEFVYVFVCVCGIGQPMRQLLMQLLFPSPQSPCSSTDCSSLSTPRAVMTRGSRISHFALNFLLIVRLIAMQNTSSIPSMASISAIFAGVSNMTVEYDLPWRLPARSSKPTRGADNLTRNDDGFGVLSIPVTLMWQRVVSCLLHFRLKTMGELVPQWARCR